jgi:hypothetical protein
MDYCADGGEDSAAKVDGDAGGDKTGYVSSV